VISPRFGYLRDQLQSPIFLFLVLYGGTWVFYGAAVWSLGLLKEEPPFLWPMILLVGVLVRVLMLSSTPILEDDFYRYIWDGKLLQRGVNSLNFAPNEVSLDVFLLEEREEAGLVQERVNYPEVKTIYPPLAQEVFLSSAFLFGWNHDGPRWTFLFFDIGIILILGSLLKKKRVSRCHLLTYLWCPLILKEVHNGLHFDILVAFFLTLFLHAHVSKRYLLALFWVFCGIWVKFTPLLLLPLYGVYLVSMKKKNLFWFGCALGSTLSFAFFWRWTYGAMDPWAGFLAFGSQWSSNGCVFPLVDKGFVSLGWSKAWARGGAACLLLGLGSFIFWKMIRGVRKPVKQRQSPNPETNRKNQRSLFSDVNHGT